MTEPYDSIKEREQDQQPTPQNGPDVPPGHLQKRAVQALGFSALFVGSLILMGYKWIYWGTDHLFNFVLFSTMTGAIALTALYKYAIEAGHTDANLPTWLVQTLLNTFR